MSFGRRTIDNSDRPSASSADERYPRASSNGGGGASGVVSVIVLALGAAIATFGVMYMLRGTSNAVVAAQSGLPAAAASAAHASHDDVAKACLPMLRGMEEPLTDAQQADRFRLGVRAASYYHCALTRDLQRFCAKADRKQLAGELTTYFESLRRQALGTKSGQWTAKMAAAVEGDGSGGIAGAAPKWAPDPQVVDLMRGMVRDGYLSAGDFGWSMPDMIKSALDGREIRKEPVLMSGAWDRD